MKEWKEYKIKNIAEVVGGGTPKTSIKEYWGGEIGWITPRDLSGYNKIYISQGERNITQLGLKKSSAKLMPTGTVLMSSRAPIGYLAIASNEISTNQGFKSLVVNQEKANNLFVYYWLKANMTYIKSNGTGSTFSEISGSVVKDLDVLLPPFSEQKAIADVLSSLDDKIDLLHRQNETLEALAETLFRQWFVEKAKEDWEATTLYEAIVLIGGGTPKTSVKEYWNGEIKWLSGGDITYNHKSVVMTSEKTITELGLNNSSAKLLPKFSTVISARGTVGKYCILSEPMTYSQSNYGIKPKFKDCFFFTYLLVSNSVEELNSAAYGSVFDTITTNTFKGIEISIPTEEEIQSFEVRVRDYFLKILNNQTQIHTLSQLRDTLLPKLMSGEVRVNTI